MKTRILSSEESRVFSPRALSCVYKLMSDRIVSAIVLETALVQAVEVAKVTHNIVDIKTFERILEQVAEDGTTCLFDGGAFGSGDTCRYC